MAAYRTPGVYVEEISTLPPSVAEVATAVPAFLGYTESGGPSVARVDTLLEYRQRFGGPKATPFKVTTAVDQESQQTVLQKLEPKEGNPGHPKFLMYYCLSHYFNNGGGSCYVISVGDYAATPTAAHFEDGLKTLEKEDEPTLIALTDAVNLGTDDYYQVCQKALALCAKLGDRFVILDVKDGDVATFRSKVGTNALKYGAAYHPYLQTSLVQAYESSAVEIEGTTAPASNTLGKDLGGVSVTYSGTSSDPKVKVVKGAEGPIQFEVVAGLLTMKDVGTKSGDEVAQAWVAWAAENDAAGFQIQPSAAGQDPVPSTGNTSVSLERAGAEAATLKSIEDSGTVLSSQIKAALATQRVTLPPSAAMAGIYARVDRERGVWKAPANVSVLSTIGPVIKISHEEQEGLNIHEAGTSINALREFAGKGTLVWGARTLAGNDNEWRYVPVRRLFNMIEESTRKASSFAVFEPNDASTWLKVKGMIDSYLYGLWERGALAGSTPDAAYFVNVGLGKTMTPQDVLEGRMIVEIGVAAVRPAEFIIIRFSHKMQEA